VPRKATPLTPPHPSMPLITNHHNPYFSLTPFTSVRVAPNEFRKKSTTSDLKERTLCFWYTVPLGEKLNCTVSGDKWRYSITTLGPSVAVCNNENRNE